MEKLSVKPVLVPKEQTAGVKHQPLHSSDKDEKWNKQSELFQFGYEEKRPGRASEINGGKSKHV